ncbi:MAG: ChrR family anti-sigma-E factor [Rhodospirillum sp.]|nr:ChrR family anti-sigma-E factor [Rhodospirillum sp.]MCF8492145.1 ChrR family anti-sigma-E factor [Rhodospirillum sp.]MCF8502598.1 ChrR family anti-sigma-E factor [Rhodospirillum sp.]
MTPAILPMHHLEPGVLAAYASGALGEGPSLLVASHLTFCPDCRAAVTDLDRVGGTLLDELGPDALNGDALDKLLARLDEPGTIPTPRQEPAPPGEGGSELAALPAPIRSYLSLIDQDGTLPWKMLAPGVRQIRLMPRGADGANARLFKLAPHTSLPDHGHEGCEWTLVLTGSFTDAGQRFARGDVAHADRDTIHAPVTGAEDCICLIITDAPLRYTGLLGRLIQPVTDL